MFTILLFDLSSGCSSGEVKALLYEIELMFKEFFLLRGIFGGFGFLESLLLLSSLGYSFQPFFFDGEELVILAFCPLSFLSWLNDRFIFISCSA